MREEGVGSNSKYTEPITRDNEEKLCSSGVLSISTPKDYSTLFFLLVPWL